MKRMILPVVLCALLVITLALYAVSSSRLTRTAHVLDSIWQAQLSSATSSLDEASLQIDKALIATEPTLQATYMLAVHKHASLADAALAIMPMDSETASAALSMLQQLIEHSESYASLLLAGMPLNDKQRTYLTETSAECVRFSTQLSLTREQWATLGISVLDRSSDWLAQDRTQRELASSFDTLMVPVIENETPRGLPDVQVSYEDALELAAQAVGEALVLRVTKGADTGGVLPTHGITVQTNDLSLNVEITKVGGKLLLMAPETASFQSLQSQQACADAAQRYLTSMGFTDMQQVAWQIYDGLLVLTYAPAQDDVLLYADLVHVQVRMDTAAVVGFEAAAYWTNHVRRSLPSPAISRDKMIDTVAAHADVLRVQLCLLPIRGTETLAYEVLARSAGETYAIYLDAQTGHELAVKKLIITSDGMIAA